ncbi:hypothetical protein [Streptomyces sp. NPDC090056]|uniref:hypothetical protein n=1 Tax=Streptomyces sp. NPDC090056 TaxID=3365934 RepID=UPI00381646D9
MRRALPRWPGGIGRRRLTTTALAGTVLLLAVTGYVSAGAPAGEGKTAAPTETVAATTAVGRSLLHDAEQELQRRCMTAAGFRYWAKPENPLPEARDFPYVVDDAKWAGRYGYGSVLEPRVEALRRQDPNRVYLGGLPPERRHATVTALNGTTDGQGLRAELPGGAVVGHSGNGCRVTAWRTLYADVAHWYAANTLVGNLGGIRQQRVTAEPEFAAAVRAWSACMREHGLPYRTPREARDTFLGGKGAADRAREMRVAVREAQCAHDSGLASVAQRLEHHHDRELRREYRTAVERVEQLRAAALPRVRAVLGR